MPGRSSSWPGAEEVFAGPAPAASADAQARQAERFEPSGRLKRELELDENKSCRPPADLKRPLIEVGHPAWSVRRQCELLGLPRSSRCYPPAGASAEDWRLIRRIDEQDTACPFSGSRRTTAWLIEQGEKVNPKRVQRLSTRKRLCRLPACSPVTKSRFVQYSRV